MNKGFSISTTIYDEVIQYELVDKRDAIQRAPGF